MGMALTPCTVPHAGKPSFELPDDEIELGIGIHGEPGRRRVKIASADEITEMLMEPIISDLPFKKGEEVLLFVNGMGGTPLIELYIVYRKAAQIAKAAWPESRPQPGWPVHHQPGDGRDLDHAAADERSTVQAMGCSRRHSGTALGLRPIDKRHGIFEC